MLAIVFPLAEGNSVDAEVELATVPAGAVEASSSEEPQPAATQVAATAIRRETGFTFRILGTGPCRGAGPPLPRPL